MKDQCVFLVMMVLMCCVCGEVVERVDMSDRDVRRLIGDLYPLYMQIIIEEMAVAFSSGNCTVFADFFANDFSVEAPHGYMTISDRTALIDSCRTLAAQYDLRVVNMSFPVFDMKNNFVGYQFNQKSISGDTFRLSSGAIFYLFNEDYSIFRALTFTDQINQDNYEVIVSTRTKAINALGIRDCATFSNYFAPDGRIIDVENTIQGRANIRAYCNRVIKVLNVFKFFASSSWVSGDMSVSYGHYVSVNSKGKGTSNTAYTFLTFNELNQITSWDILSDKPSFTGN